MIRSLQRRKIRQQERAFIVEGLRAVDDVLAAGITPLALYVREDIEPNGIPVVSARVPVRRVVSRVFDELTDVPHPQGILAIVPMLAEPDVPSASAESPPLILVVDGVRDPGNLGTLLRSAAGAGVDHVVIGPETVDIYHPRTVRAAMGAHMRVPFSHRTWQYLAASLNGYENIALADASGDLEYDQVAWTASSALIVGGEAFGPTAAAWEASTSRVAIPLASGVESLNAGVAGSLLLFEAARQRRIALRALSM